MARKHPRIERESKTVEAMIRIYCHGQHGTSTSLCDECTALTDYARQRLHKCPFQEGKTTCANCPVHCYKPDMRAQIRVVMRYSGPRMIYRHPVMTLQHMVDGSRTAPARPAKAKSPS